MKAAAAGAASFPNSRKGCGGSFSAHAAVAARRPFRWADDAAIPQRKPAPFPETGKDAAPGNPWCCTCPPALK